MSAPTPVPICLPAPCASGADDAAAAAAAPTVPATVLGSERPWPLGGGAHDHQHEHDCERHVQPRLDGPITHANNEGDAAAGARCDAPGQGHSSLSAAGRLHRHALECIFAFLDLHGLAAALRVSRDWTDAVQSMRRLDLAVEQPSAPPAELARSAAVRHIARLGGNCYMVRLSSADFSLIAGRMIHLRELHCMLDEGPSSGQPQPLLFPAQLQRLHVDLTDPAAADCDAADLNGAIAAIGRLPLLEELTIHFPAVDPLVSFVPLAALPQLRRFLILPRNEMEFSDAQIDQLRALPRLREVFLRLTTALLRRLLRQPHSLQWQVILLPEPLDDEAAALLPQLPSLTKIDSSITCGHFEWLSGLPNLTAVHLLFVRREGAADAAGRCASISLVGAMRHCANIEILEIDDCSGLSAAHLADLLPRLPRLRQLTLGYLFIDSLAFLAQPPLTTQLSRLRLSGCRQLPVGELRHVHALRGLTELEFWCSFTGPLDEHERSLLTPPSAVLPQLTEFEYAYRAPVL